ncbi:hypothetical protein FB567DRAFT_140746 [Paraphoma chrysanthemicola]|uniref:Uncharacterized protein n=1 Tax=Paraphoma chrysanthemicola TaxID=798071 RepID=A0A8K0VU65_9PLEO|nr:hypothetical protein FB567DRAFT_140746 [Paraphoma chrysanthemicola]
MAQQVQSRGAANYWPEYIDGVVVVQSRISSKRWKELIVLESRGTMSAGGVSCIVRWQFQDVLIVGSLVGLVVQGGWDARPLRGTVTAPPRSDSLHIMRSRTGWQLSSILLQLIRVQVKSETFRLRRCLTRFGRQRSESSASPLRLFQHDRNRASTFVHTLRARLEFELYQTIHIAKRHCGLSIYNVNSRWGRGGWASSEWMRLSRSVHAAYSSPEVVSVVRIQW